MQKIFVGIALALVIIASGTYIINQSGASSRASDETQVATQNTQTQTTTGTATQTGGTAAPTAKTYTLADVAQHTNQSSCWTTINGKVYDVTAWISKHPGGSRAILGLCGKDGSSAFNGQHGGQGRPASELATFIIGDLSN